MKLKKKGNKKRKRKRPQRSVLCLRSGSLNLFRGGSQQREERKKRRKGKKKEPMGERLLLTMVYCLLS